MLPRAGSSFPARCSGKTQKAIPTVSWKGKWRMTKASAMVSPPSRPSGVPGFRKRWLRSLVMTRWEPRSWAAARPESREMMRRPERRPLENSGNTRRRVSGQPPDGSLTGLTKPKLPPKSPLTQCLYLSGLSTSGTRDSRGTWQLPEGRKRTSSDRGCQKPEREHCHHRSLIR